MMGALFVLRAHQPPADDFTHRLFLMIVFDAIDQYCCNYSEQYEDEKSKDRLVCDGDIT